MNDPIWRETWRENSKSLGHYQACRDGGMSDYQIEMDWLKTEKELDRDYKERTMSVEEKANELVIKSVEQHVSFKNRKGKTLLTLKETNSDGEMVWDFPCLYRSTEDLRELHAAITIVLAENPPKDFNDSNNLPF